MFPPFSLEDLVDLYKEQFKKGRKESLQRDKESPGGFTLAPSENYPSYGTQEG